MQSPTPGRRRPSCPRCRPCRTGTGCRERPRSSWPRGRPGRRSHRRLRSCACLRRKRVMEGGRLAEVAMRCARRQGRWDVRQGIRVSCPAERGQAVPRRRQGELRTESDSNGKGAPHAAGDAPFGAVTGVARTGPEAAAIGRDVLVGSHGDGGAPAHTTTWAPAPSSLMPLVCLRDLRSFGNGNVASRRGVYSSGQCGGHGGGFRNPVRRKGGFRVAPERRLRGHPLSIDE